MLRARCVSTVADRLAPRNAILYGVKTFDAAEQFETLFQYIGDEPDAGKGARVFPASRTSSVVWRCCGRWRRRTCSPASNRPRRRGGFRHFLDQLVLHRDKLMPRGIDPRDIKIGVIRDALFSAMADTARGRDI